ncbi:MAG: hypothetical protein IKD08_04765 [Alphaproteobacteria bacterium]|nr:hypothetical protein [Alphaproteobacteria bacterium]
MSNIPLTANVRQTLYALKNVQQLTAQTSLRLNTGKKVNDVTDNMPAYIKSSQLSNRAAEMSKLLDNAQQTIQMIKVAQEGLSQISALIENAKSMANLALGTNADFSLLVGTEKIASTEQIITDIPSVTAGDTFILKTGEIDKAVTSGGNFSESQTVSEAGIAAGEPLYIKIGDDAWVEVAPSSGNMTMQQYMDSIEKTIGEDKISAEIKDGEIVLTAKDGKPIFLQDNPVNNAGNPDAASTLGFDTGNVLTITDGMTAEDLMTQISAINGINAELSLDNNIRITDDFGRELAISDLQGQSAKALGIAGTTTNGRTANKSYAASFDSIIEQINSIVKDCSYGGINLLEGDNYTAFFDEKRQNGFTVRGIDASSEALGFTATENNWEHKADIEKSLNQIETALSKINYASEIYAHNFSTVTASSDYMQVMQDTIIYASDEIVAADDEEEAAKLLSLEVMQELCVNALSLSSQTTSAILKIFG